MVTETVTLKAPSLSAVAAAVGALAGVVGTVLTPLYLHQLTPGIADILQGFSALLVLVPVHHAAATARAKAIHAAGASTPAVVTVPAAQFKP